MVGAGIFNREFTRRAEARLIPEGANWIKASASGFAPDENKVLLCDGRNLSYRVLIACPGIKLDWDAIGFAGHAGAQRRHLELQLRFRSLYPPPGNGVDRQSVV